ncbi:hypothetical protein JOL62DRAFT_206218 [Phyllosticta paracitricarpa]|uniref:Uncharacterized protein n=1 Tax=Phyllosticta paracitricarpa TaxID=2016321 RepID=A0ABR1N370_9PEZI
MGNAESTPSKSSSTEKAQQQKKKKQQQQQKGGGGKAGGLACCGKRPSTPDEGGAPTPPRRRLIAKAPSIPDSNSSDASTASRSVRSNRNAALPALPPTGNGSGNGSGKKTLHRRTDSVITAAAGERAAAAGAGGANGSNLVVPYNEAHISTFEKEIMGYAAILHPGETSVKVSIRPFNEGYSVDRNQWDVRWVGRLVTRRTVLTAAGEPGFSFIPLYESVFSTPSVYSWRHSTADVQIRARLTHMLLGEVSMAMAGMFGPDFKDRLRRGEKLRLAGRSSTFSSATSSARQRPPSMQRGHSLSRQQSFQHQQQQQKLLQQQHQQSRGVLQRQSTWHGGTSSSYAHSDGGRSISSYRSVPRGLGIQVPPPDVPVPALPPGVTPVGRYTRPPRPTYRPWETAVRDV